MSTVDPALSAIVALSIALLFGAAVYHKLADWPRFRAALEGLRVLPASLTLAAAVLVVVLECTAALMLPFTSTRPPGAILAAGLLAAYALAIGVNLRRGRTSIDCGCLGVAGRSRIGGWMVLRNMALAVAVLAAALPIAARDLAALDAVTIVGAIASLAFLYVAQELLQGVATGPARAVRS